MKLVPEIEFASAREIEKFQMGKLEDLVRYLLHHSPFYKRHLSKHAISTVPLNGRKDLQRIPVTTKDDLRQFNWDFLCIPEEQVADFSVSSGTTGHPVTIALSHADVQRLAYNEAISFTAADGTAADRYQLMLTMDRQFMAGLAYYEGIRKLGAGVVRVGPGLPALQWDTIHRLKPTTLVAVPSFVAKFLDYAKANQINVNDSSVKKIICIGENIRTTGLKPNTLARRITDHWHVSLYGTYASTEMQTAFTECRHGLGGHHHPDLVIIELLDNNNEPVPEGEPGELTITTLGVEAMPLLRFKTGDITRVFTDTCACGRTTWRLGPVEGRRHQMIKLKGTTLYPPAIDEIVHAHPEIQEYAVEVFTGEFDTEDLRIYIVTEPGLHARVRGQLTETFQSRLRVTPHIAFVSRQELEQIVNAGQGRKINRFIDSRSH